MGWAKCLEQKKSDLEQRLNHLSQQIAQLQRGLILETRSDEKLRLEDVIAGREAEAEQLKEELVELEAKLSQPLNLVDVCPYPGMIPFSAENARFFYGRDDEIREMLRRLRDQRYFFIIGPSGSGKSSLVSAGLLPQLTRNGRFPPDFWLVREMRPSSQPLQILSQIIQGDPVQPGPALAHLLAGPSPKQRLLLAIDQFEELFTQAERVEQNSFIAALQALRPLENCTLLIMMRADFYPDLMNSDLWPLTPGQRLEIAPLRGEALRRAIQQPAIDVGVALETELLERLLADIADEPGALPLLQETMVRLWEEMEGCHLSLSAYERMGREGRSGLAVAMALKADAALADLSEGQQAIARRIFLRLVQFGEGRADTRRQEQMVNLRVRGEELALFDQTLQHLVRHRLLTLSGEAREPNKLADLAHERLIQSWPTLQEWLAEQREFLLWRQRLDARQQEWAKTQPDEGPLLRGAALIEAEHWLGERSDDLNQPEYDFIQASLDLREREARERERQAREQEELRQRNLEAAQELAELNERRAEEQAQNAKRLRRRAISLSIALGVVFILLISAGILAYLANVRRLEAQESQAAALAAQAVTLANDDQLEPALLLSLEANRLADEAGANLPVTRGSLLYTLQTTSPHLETILRGSTARVHALAFSPDGQTLAYSIQDGVIVLWDVATRQPFDLPLFGDVFNPTFSLAFSPDGQILASSNCMEFTEKCDRSEIRLWNLRTHKFEQRFRGHSDEIYSLAFSPDGQILASGSGDNTIMLWNVDTGQPMTQPLRHHTDRVRSIVFSPDGKILASGSDDTTVILWEVKTGQPINSLLTDHTGQVYSLAFSPDGKTLVSGSQDGAIIMWDTSHPSVRHTLTDQLGEILSLAFSPKGQLLASASSDRTIMLWELASGRLLEPTLYGHVDKVNHVAFSPDGQTLASSSDDGSVALWDVGAYYLSSSSFTLGRLAEVFDIGVHNISSLVASPDGKTLALGGSEGAIALWTVDKGQSIGQPLTGHAGRIDSLDISADNRLLASSSTDQALMLWDMSKSQPLALSLPSPPISFSSLRFSPDGKILASGSAEGTIILWEMDSRQPIGQPLIGHTGAVTSLAFDSDSKILASGSENDEIILWDITTRSMAGQSFKNFTLGVSRIAFSPDGQTLYVGGYNGAINLWDVDTHSFIQPFSGHTDYVTDLIFSPDGQTLASSSRDKTVVLWDIATAQEIGLPFSHAGPVNSLAFSRNGQMLAAAEEGQLILWDVDRNSWRQRACSLVARNLTWSEWQQYFPGQSYRKICPNLPAHYSVITEFVTRAGRSGDVSVYIQALNWTLETKDTGLNNFVCSFGSYYGFKASLQACEYLVTLAPDNGRLRGSRGLARAILLKQVDLSVIEDLKAAIAWYQENNLVECAKNRQQWLNQANLGQYPFGVETIEFIKSQESC